MDDGKNSIFPEFQAGPLNNKPLTPGGKWTTVYTNGCAFGLVEVLTNPHCVVMTICDETGEVAKCEGPNPLVVKWE